MANVFYKFNQWKTNRKGEEIQERLKEKLYGREFDTSVIRFDEIVSSISELVRRKNVQYPRTKPFKVEVHEHDAHKIIEVRTDVKTFAENRVCEIHCMPIVGSVTLFDVRTLHLQEQQ